MRKILLRLAAFLVVAASTPAAASTETFMYDALGRLTAVITSTKTTSYTYDAAGNRKAVVIVDNTVVNWGNFNWNNAAWHN